MCETVSDKKISLVIRERSIFSCESATGLRVGPAIYKTLGVDPVAGKVGGRFLGHQVGILGHEDLWAISGILGHLLVPWDYLFSEPPVINLSQFWHHSLLVGPLGKWNLITFSLVSSPQLSWFQVSMGALAEKTLTGIREDVSLTLQVRRTRKVLGHDDLSDIWSQSDRSGHHRSGMCSGGVARRDVAGLWHAGAVHDAQGDGN